MNAKSLNSPTFSSTKPPSAFIRGNRNIGLVYIRDQFTISTWLLIGAALQSILFLLPIRAPYLLGAASLLLGIKCLNHLLMTIGVKENIYLDGTVEGKTTARFPNQPVASTAEGKETGDSNDGKICVVFIGVRCNHPLGMLAPGFSQLSTHFRTMSLSLEQHASTNGFLGASTYLNADSRTTSSELMTVFYFDSMDAVHAFAHGPAHREGWDWWVATVKEHRHIGIFHEIYEAPRGKWEILYENHHATGAAATSGRVVDGREREGWVGAWVDGSKYRLRVERGQMGMRRASVEDVVETGLEV